MKGVPHNFSKASPLKILKWTIPKKRDGSIFRKEVMVSYITFFPKCLKWTLPSFKMVRSIIEKRCDDDNFSTFVKVSLAFFP